MIGIQDLPPLNAILNGTATTLLLIGHSKIKQRKVDQHRKWMIAAFSVSVLFLISYLTYHYEAGVVRFEKPGVVRTIYLWILATHTVLAAIVPFLAIITLVLGLKRRDAKHRRIARWAYPIWLYVSVTGVIVYLLLYQVQPRL
jgi:putative membrane protein